MEKIFPAKTESLDDVLAFTESALEEAGASMKDTMQVSVAIEEVFVNVAHYAYGEGEGLAELSIDPTEDGITFVLKDEGTPFNPLAKEDPDITLSAEERNIGGLGIFMTKKIMDEVSYVYEEGKNILTMHKKLKG